MDGAAKGSVQPIFDVVGAEMTWMQVKWSLNSDQNFVVYSAITSLIFFPDLTYFFAANEFELVQKIFLCSRRIFQNILLSLHPLLQKNFGRFFLGVYIFF
jgi:hypothetical protein